MPLDAHELANFWGQTPFSVGLSTWTVQKPVDKRVLRGRYEAFIKRFSGLHCIGAQALLELACRHSFSEHQRSVAGADCSTVRLIDASATSSDERVLSRTIFRSTEPLTPVNPSCSELLSVTR
jgi:hypothetical protein